METVGGSTTSSQFTAQLLVGDTFNPQLPLVFGRYEKGGDVVGIACVYKYVSSCINVYPILSLSLT